MHCTAEEAPLEGVVAEVLVSEWMGYLLIFERMLPSFLAIRDKCLSHNGIMIPCRVRIILAAAALANVSNPSI